MTDASVTTTPSFFAFIGVILCWIGFWAIYAFRKQPPKVAERARNPESRTGIVIQSLGYVFVWALRRSPGRPHFPGGETAEWVISVIAVLIGVASVVLVRQSVRTLGKQWAYAARIVEGHELITSGPYGIVRNPIYLGMFGLLIATGLAISQWWSLALGMIVFLMGTVRRIRSEEKLLRDAFGSQFEDYARRVKALIPGIY